MPGFPLAAIGAGLGEWAQNYQQQRLLQQNQQDQQLRRQLQMMQLQELLRTKQSDRAAADAAAGFLTGGTGIAPVNPTGNMPGSQAVPAALAVDSALNAPSTPVPQSSPYTPTPGGAGIPTMGGSGLAPGFAQGPDGRLTRNGQPPDTHIGGLRGPGGGSTPAWQESFTPAPRDAGLEWLNQNAPVPTQANPNPPPPRFTMNEPGPEAYAEAQGPGAPGMSPTTARGDIPPPRAGGGPNAPSAWIGAPPPEYDPATTAAAIKRAHPEISNQDLVKAVELVGKELGPKVKGAYERWKTQAELYYRGRSADTADAALAETTRYHGVEAEQRGQAQTETARHNVAGEQLGQGQLAETTRAHNLMDNARTRSFNVQAQKAQAKTGAEVAELKTLADQARQLYAAVEENPNIVGVRGRGARLFGSAAEQAKWKQEDAAAAELKSRISLLQARLQKPLLGARYFSGKAQEQMAQLVPGLAALDNPTAVKSALRNLAEQLEGKAAEIEATSKGVYGDASALSDDAVREELKQMGIEPVR